MSESKPRRVRPAFRRIAIAIFIVLVPVAAHALWDQIEMRRLVREIEAIRAKGEPATEHDAGLYFKGTTDDHKRASRQYLAAGMLALHVRSVGDIAELREWLAGDVAPKRSVEEMRAALRAVIDREADAMKLADSANAMEFRGFEPGTEYSYRTSGLTSLTYLFSARTAHLALAGRGDEAAAAAVESLTLRRIEQEARWLYLMNPGDHQVPLVLSFSSPSPESLHALQTALEAAELSYDPTREVTRRRAIHIEMIWRQYYGVDPNAPQNYTMKAVPFAAWVYRPWFTHALVRSLRAGAEIVEATRRPWPEKAILSEALHQKYGTEAANRRMFEGARFGRNVVPSLGYADAERLILDRSSRTAVAIERFRRGNGGALPESVEALVPAYLAAAPQDPLAPDGAPLRFRAAGKGYTVYSIGKDGKDDSGDLASELHAVVKRGWGRRELKGRDVGIRVWIH